MFSYRTRRVLLPRVVGVAILLALALEALGATAGAAVKPGPNGYPPRYVTNNPNETELGPPADLISESFSVQAAFGPARYVISVPNGCWTMARNAPAGYTIGNGYGGCGPGWTFDVVQRNQARTWYQGWMYGDVYQGCAWILANNINPAGGTPQVNCPQGWQLFPSQFGVGFNCTGCSAGKRVYLQAAATVYGNARPWINPAQPSTYFRTLPAGKCVEWRYVALGGGWVMMKDRTIPDVHGSWGFVPRSSLPAVLPTGQETCPAGT